MSLLPMVEGQNGHYDDSGMWQRDKYCFVDCGEKCDCGPPGGNVYSIKHDKRTQETIGQALEPPK